MNNPQLTTPTDALPAGELSALTDFQPEAIACEIVQPESDANSSAADIDAVEQMLGRLDAMAEDELVSCIHDCAFRAADMAKAAMKAASSALAHAWACGTMLNAAKARCGHGRFGAWLDKHLRPTDICARTCQRYMKLARQHADLRSLLETPVSLRQACVACATAPGSEPVAVPRKAKLVRGPDLKHDSEELLPSQAVMASVNALVANISRFAASGHVLGGDDLGLLQLAKDTIDKLYARIRATQESV